VGAEVQAVELKPSSGNEDKLACGERDPSEDDVGGPSDLNTLEINFRARSRSTEALPNEGKPT